VRIPPLVYLSAIMITLIFLVVFYGPCGTMTAQKPPAQPLNGAYDDGAGTVTFVLEKSVGDSRQNMAAIEGIQKAWVDRFPERASQVLRSEPHFDGFELGSGCQSKRVPVALTVHYGIASAPTK